MTLLGHIWKSKKYSHCRHCRKNSLDCDILVGDLENMWHVVPENILTPPSVRFLSPLPNPSQNSKLGPYFPLRIVAFKFFPPPPPLKYPFNPLSGLKKILVRSYGTSRFSFWVSRFSFCPAQLERDQAIGLPSKTFKRTTEDLPRASKIWELLVSRVSWNFQVFSSPVWLGGY